MYDGFSPTGSQDYTRLAQRLCIKSNIYRRIATEHYPFLEGSFPLIRLLLMLTIMMSSSFFFVSSPSVDLSVGSLQYYWVSHPGNVKALL